MYINKLLIILLIPFLITCQKYYPLLFSIDGSSWSKEFEYTENDLGIKLWGSYKPRYNAESLLHLGLRCVENGCFKHLNKENFKIESNLTYFKQTHISTDGSTASIALSVYHRNYRELPEKDLINYIDSTYIIVNISELFDNDLSIQVKMDVMKDIIN